MALSKGSAMGDHRRAYLNASQAANAAHPSGRPDPVDSHRTIGSHEASPQAPRAQVSQSAKRQSREVITAGQRDRRAPSSETGTASSEESAMSDKRQACIDASHRAYAAHASDRPEPLDSLRTIGSGSPVPSTSPRSHRSIPDELAVSLAPRSERSSPPGRPGGQSSVVKDDVDYVEIATEEMLQASYKVLKASDVRALQSARQDVADAYARCVMHLKSQPKHGHDPVAGFTFGKKVF